MDEFFLRLMVPGNMTTKGKIVRKENVHIIAQQRVVEIEEDGFYHSVSSVVAG